MKPEMMKSKIEFETNTDFATLDHDARLEVLRVFGNLLPDITASSMTFSRALSDVVLHNARSLEASGDSNLEQVMASLEKEANGLVEDYGRRVLAYIGAACELMRVHGLQSEQPPAKN